MNPVAKILIAAALGALSACGLRGDLERPDPIFGSPDATDVDAAQPLPDTTDDDGLGDDVFDDPEDELLGGPDGL